MAALSMSVHSRDGLHARQLVPTAHRNPRSRRSPILCDDNSSSRESTRTRWPGSSAKRWPHSGLAVAIWWVEMRSHQPPGSAPSGSN